MRRTLLVLGYLCAALFMFSSDGLDAASRASRPVAAGPASATRAGGEAGVAQDGRDRTVDEHPVTQRILVFDDSFPWGPWGWGWYPTYGYELPYGAPAAYLNYVPKGLVPVELHVHPWKASVSVDGNTLGEARDYNEVSHPLWLLPGHHDLQLRYGGFETLEFQLDVKKGLPRDLHYDLVRGQGVDPRSQLAAAAGAGKDTAS